VDKATVVVNWTLMTTFVALTVGGVAVIVPTDAVAPRARGAAIPANEAIINETMIKSKTEAFFIEHLLVVATHSVTAADHSATSKQDESPTYTTDIRPIV
jgi:hypothetical protein